MKKIAFVFAISFITCLLLIAGLFGAFAFANYSLNPASWSWCDRGFCALLAAFVFALAIFIPLANCEDELKALFKNKK